MVVTVIVSTLWTVPVLAIVSTGVQDCEQWCDHYGSMCEHVLTGLFPCLLGYGYCTLLGGNVPASVPFGAVRSTEEYSTV